MLTAAAALTLCACSASRDLPDDARMLRMVRIVTEGKYSDISTSQMKK